MTDRTRRESSSGPRWVPPLMTGVTLAACVAMAAPSDAAGQDGAVTISGSVVEADTERPIEGARVLLVGSATDQPGQADAEPALSSWTDADGHYQFTGLASGSYRMTVSRMGYSERTLALEVPYAAAVRRGIGLEIDPVQLSALEVRGARIGVTSAMGTMLRPPLIGEADPAQTPASRATSPGDSRTLSADDVRSLSTLGEPDVLRALHRLPGVSSQGDFSAEPWVRGAPWGMTRVLFDGLPLYDPLHLGGSISGLAADGLDSVVLLPGVRPAAMADGAAATVNLTTRRARAQPTRTAAVSPLAIRGHLEERMLGERVGVSLTARRSWWDWLGAPGSPTGVPSSGPIDYSLTDITARVDARLPGRLLLEGGAMHERDRLDGDIPGLVGESRGRWGNQAGWASLDREWNRPTGAVSVRALVGRSAHTSWTRSRPWNTFLSRGGLPSLDWMDLEIEHTLMRLSSAGRAFGGSLSWGLGVDRIRETLSQGSIEATDRNAPGSSAQAILSRSRPWAEVGAHFDRAEFTSGLAWDLVEGDAPPAMEPLPNARIRLHPHERLSLEAAWGRSRQTAYPLAPSGSSIGPDLGMGHVWMLAGAEIPPLNSETGTLTAQSRISDGVIAGLTVWQRQIRGLALNGVATIHDGVLRSPVEDHGVGREEGRGLEVFLARSGERASGSVAYSRGRSEMEGTTEDRWTSPAERRHSVNLAFDSRLFRGLRGATFLTWESGWPFAVGPWDCVDENGCDIPLGDPLRPETHSFERARDYRSLDLRLDWQRESRIGEWSASVSIRNLLGWKNVAAYRPSGCRGRAQVSVVCTELIGMGSFASGPAGPTPAASLQLRF